MQVLQGRQEHGHAWASQWEEALMESVCEVADSPMDLQAGLRIPWYLMTVTQGQKW